MVITDAQVHLWGAEAPNRPWDEDTRRYLEEAGDISSAGRGSFGAEQLLAEMDGAGVDRAVLVPPVFAGDDNAFALAAAAKYPERLAVMGRLPLDRPDTGRLREWLRHPGMLGVRLTFFYPRHVGWLSDGTADWVWPVLEELEVPTAVFAPGLTPAVGAVAERHPGLRMVVDHFGIPQRARDAKIIPFVDQLIRLAGLPNVRVKASALSAHSSEPFPFSVLHDPIRRVVDAFGPERVFWGSEMTRMPQPYTECVRLFSEALTFLDPDARTAIMGGALSTWLGWPPEPRRPS